tara:strand:+ start:416 stop:553 length:138 start_codon:yes stop_codon:yes gene_type:complete
VTPFIYGARIVAMIASFICGALFIGMSFRKETIYNKYGLWDKAVV